MSTQTAPPPAIKDRYSDTARMLIVDDDPGVGMALEDFFEHHGYDVTLATDGDTALDLLKEQPTGFDLVMLDVMLPGKNGFEILEASGEIGVTAPILMVTAKGEKENVLKGLGLGADDYIVKPFAAETLLKRIKRLLGQQRNATEEPPDVYKFGDIEIDFTAGSVKRGGRRMDLTDQQVDLLRLLVQHQGEVISVKRLLKEAWGLDLDHVSFSVSPQVASQTLEKNLRTIQEQIEADPNNPKHLEMVPGLGYRFNG